MMETESTPILSAYLQNDAEDSSADNGDFPYQVVIIAAVQAAICGIVVSLICSANNYLSLCKKITLMALVL